MRIIQLQNIGDGCFENSYKLFTSESKARALHSDLIFPGEIVIAKMADPLARAAVLPSVEKKYLLGSDGIRLSVDRHCFDTYFVMTEINDSRFRKKAESHSTGSTRKRIGLPTLGSLQLDVPSLSEQKRIGDVFKNIDSVIALHQREC